MNKRMQAPGSKKGSVRAKKQGSVLNAINIILSVILGISILVTCFVMRDASDVYYDSEESLYYSLSDGRYSDLADRYNQSGIGREDDKKIQELADYYAVGRYFEKAFFATAFEKAGMTEKAAAFRAQMDEIETQMGEFSGEKDRILEILQQ